MPSPPAAFQMLPKSVSLGSLLLFLLAISPFMAAAPTAHAQTLTSITTSNGSTVCRTTLGGTWDGATDTCSLTATLSVPSGTTLDAGAGVTVRVTTNGQGLENSGTVNNAGAMGFVSDGGSGVYNAGIINNAGTLNGSSVGSVGGGVYNSGTINNAGAIYGSSIESPGTINNAGTLQSGPGETSNGGAINDYCGSVVSGRLEGSPPDDFACYRVVFEQSGIPASGVTWGVSASWGPFVLAEDHTGTGGNITLQAAGSLDYSFDTAQSGPGEAFDCVSGCTGTVALSGATTLTAGYRLVSSTTSVPGGSRSTTSASQASGLALLYYSIPELTVVAFFVVGLYLILVRGGKRGDRRGGPPPQDPASGG